MKYAANVVSFIFIIMYVTSCQYMIIVDWPWNKHEESDKAIEFHHNNFLTKIESSKKHSNPVFIDFYTTWCAPCKVMDRDVFTQSEVVSFLNQNFINLKVNAEKGEGKKMSRKYNVSAYPTLLFIDANGEEVGRHVGMLSVNAMTKLAKKSIKG